MYRPAHFDEGRSEVLLSVMRGSPLACLVVSSVGGLAANHLPLGVRGGVGGWCLAGHVA